MLGDAHTRRLLTAVALAVAALLAFAGVASADLLSPESGPSPNANKIDTLYWIIFGVAIVVFVGVEGALIYSMVKFRARKGAVAAQIRGNTRLEIGWTVGAAVILVVLSVVTFVVLDDIRNPVPSSAPGTTPLLQGKSGDEPVLKAAVTPLELPDDNAMEVVVNGQQYIWRYTYPDDDDNPLNNAFSYETMVVPVGRTVILKIRAQDVVHSWWIPKLGGKFDAVPGHTNYTWFKATEPGLWRGQCAELCGRGHANMEAHVQAVPTDRYDAFIERRKREIATANEAAAEQREQLEGGE